MMQLKVYDVAPELQNEVAKCRKAALKIEGKMRETMFWMLLLVNLMRNNIVYFLASHNPGLQNIMTTDWNKDRRTILHLPNSW